MTSMIAAFDVNYIEEQVAVAAAVLFNTFTDSQPASCYVTLVDQIHPYIPGQFYKRELPCLLAVLKAIHEKLDVMIIDGYVMLGDSPGLGYHLWKTLDKKVAVIGVAKRPFADVQSEKIFRGKSRKPLYITAAGIDPSAAAGHISSMHGPYRIPTLLNHADRLARQRQE